MVTRLNWSGKCGGGGRFWGDEIESFPVSWVSEGVDWLLEDFILALLVEDDKVLILTGCNWD